MTYTRFEVKSKNCTPYIPEYKISFPTVSEKISNDKVQEIEIFEEANKPIVEINCEESAFEKIKKSKYLSIFNAFTIILSITILFSTAITLKYALEHEIYAPDKLTQFFRRLTYAFESKNVSAFWSCPIEIDIESTQAEPISTNYEYNFENSHSDEILENSTTYTTDSIPVTHTEDEIKSDIGEEAFPILKADVSHFGETLLINDTNYTPNLEILSEESIATFASATDTLSSGLPLVLIYHTHGTECYSPNSDFYTLSTKTRSDNIENNVVSVGTELTNILNSFGINTIHCETMHDLESYTKSYSNSYQTVKKYLAEYPSIKYVIDLHRDSIVKSTNEKIKTYTVINKEETAQIMMVIGTDESGKSHPNWQQNLSLAFRVEKEISKKYPTLARPINLRKARFNQELLNGSILLEVGSCGNTLEEAKAAVRMFGISYAKIILENETPK